MLSSLFARFQFGSSPLEIAFSNNYRQFFATACKAVGYTNAEDILQNLAVLVKMHAGKTFRHPAAYLRSCLHHEICGVYKQRGRQQYDCTLLDKPSTQPEAETIVEQKESVERLREGIKQLSPEDQKIVSLLMQELKSKEITQILRKTSDAATRQAISRVYARLRAILLEF